MDNTLKEILKLQDSAQDAEVIGAVKQLIENHDRLDRETRNSKRPQHVRRPSARRPAVPKPSGSWMPPLPTDGSMPQARRRT